MFLQSYIHRATQTLQWLTITSCSLEQICEEQHVEPYEVVRTGLEDLRECLRAYRGMTCASTYLSDIASNRVATEHVSDSCSRILRALERGFSVHDALQEGASKYLDVAIRTMEQARWDNWRDARVMYYRGNYCPRYGEKAFQPEKSRLPLKCVARYTPVEGSALQETLDRARCDSQGTSVEATSSWRKAQWHDLCDISIPYSKQTIPYIFIFESEELSDYRKAMINYWIYLVTSAEQEAE